MIFATGGASVSSRGSAPDVLVAVIVLLGGNHLRDAGPFSGLTRRACPKYPTLWPTGLALRRRAPQRVHLCPGFVCVLNEYTTRKAKARAVAQRGCGSAADVRLACSLLGLYIYILVYRYPPFAPLTYYTVGISLGRRLVNLLPVAQRTNALTKWRRRQTMGRWS